MTLNDDGWAELTRVWVRRRPIWAEVVSLLEKTGFLVNNKILQKYQHWSKTTWNVACHFQMAHFERFSEFFGNDCWLEILSLTCSQVYLLRTHSPLIFAHSLSFMTSDWRPFEDCIIEFALYKFIHSIIHSSSYCYYNYCYHYYHLLGLLRWLSFSFLIS